MRVDTRTNVELTVECSLHQIGLLGAIINRGLEELTNIDKEDQDFISMLVTELESTLQGR